MSFFETGEGSLLEKFMRNRQSMSPQRFERELRKLTSRTGHSRNRCTAAEQKRRSQRRRNQARHKRHVRGR